MAELLIKHLMSVLESAHVTETLLSLGLPMCSIWKIMGVVFELA